MSDYGSDYHDVSNRKKVIREIIDSIGFFDASLHSIPDSMPEEDNAHRIIPRYILVGADISVKKIWKSTHYVGISGVCFKSLTSRNGRNFLYNYAYQFCDGNIYEAIDRSDDSIYYETEDDSSASDLLPLEDLLFMSDQEFKLKHIEGEKNEYI